MKSIPELLQAYADYISAGDKEGILSLYAPDASCEIPVGGPVHRGIAAIRDFYTRNELAQQVRISGACCVAGREAAVPMKARISRNGQILELDVIDVVEVDEQGRFKRLRAFFSLDAATADEVGR